MFDKDISFHSDRGYPVILKSGSASYSKGSNAVSVDLTSIGANQDFIAFKETGGWRSLPDPANEKIYINSAGRLTAYMGNFASESGLIYWRVYGS